MTDRSIEPFVRDAWYVAAWSHELGAAPLARRILGEDVVLFRGPDTAAPPRSKTAAATAPRR